MLRKLKRSFVRVTMLSAALVLLILMGIVNVLNYIQRDNADHAILTMLAENDGHLPSGGRGGRGRFEGNINEARYFTVSLSPDGWLLACNLTQTPWVEQEEAVALARSLQTQGKTSGVYGEYKYATASRDGNVMYIFLVWSQNMAAMRSFFMNSLVVTVLGLAVLYVLARLLAGRAVRPIAESYEKQKTFITNAGHELKTPLAVIESSTEVIELETGESRWTRSIHGQVERLSGLVGELVALARMDEESTKLSLTDTDISAVAEETLAPFAAMAEQKGLGFSAEIRPGIHLPSDRASLEKLCAILADNAVKYCAPAGEIRFTLTREGSHVLLRSENPAQGLAAGRQEQLFERFYRGDTSHSGEQPGYGLGLPLARSLAEAMGGGLTAESPDGERLVVTAKLT